MGIHLSNNADCSITAYCNSDWVACPDTRKLVSGFVVLMGGTILFGNLRYKHLSSAEAEHRVVIKVVGELVWLKRLLIELDLPCNLPIFVFCDSQAPVHIAKKPVFHERTKHIKVDCHFVRAKLQEGLITLHHILTNDQLADYVTKALPSAKHSNIRLVSYSPPT